MIFPNEKENFLTTAKFYLNNNLIIDDKWIYCRENICQDIKTKNAKKNYSRNDILSFLNDTGKH